MKLSKSIIIFLFALPILGVFSYALKRTNGNVYKSVLFTLYFLAIKIGLIAPNVFSKLDQHQPNSQLISRVQPGPVYNPYVSVFDDYHTFELYMDNIKRPVSQPKHDHISYKYFSKSKEELLLLIYATDPRLGSNQQVLKLVKELRGGSWSVIGTARFIGLIILIFSMGEGFVLNNPNPGWGLGHQNPLQPPTPEHRYPPSYDLVFPRRTCYADRPGGSQIMAGINPQSSREELTQVSTNVVPTQTQMSGFVKNGKVDLNQAFNEVNRRASAIGCETFDCSFDRFKELVNECGEIKESGVREAITILQGEMQGYYKNARRVNYGHNVKGIDFVVDGVGDFENITHAEAKNAVGSAIEKADGFDPNIWKQGKKIGKKSVWQKKFWSNRSRTSQVPNLNSDAYLPESVDNTLTVVDCYDVPNFEKETMNSAISFGAKNDTNLVILNNRTNI